jgi:hypothetical protein
MLTFTELDPRLGLLRVRIAFEPILRPKAAVHNYPFEWCCMICRCCLLLATFEYILEYPSINIDLHGTSKRSEVDIVGLGRYSISSVQPTLKSRRKRWIQYSCTKPSTLRYADSGRYDVV